MKTLAFALCFFGLTGSALADCGWSVRCNEREFQIDRMRNDLRTLESQQSDQEYSADRQQQSQQQLDALFPQEPEQTSIDLSGE